MKNLYLLLFLVASCSQTPKAPVKPNIVLIQGLHLDESAWNNVKYTLIDQGYEVTTFNRTGRDSEKPKLLNTIAKQSCDLTPNNSTVVGHSYGGAIIAEMVGICPKKFKKIIYVAATVPIIGEAPMAHLSSVDKAQYAKAVTLIGNGLRPKKARQFFKVSDPYFKYDKLSEPKLYSESMNLHIEPVDYEEKDFDRIPKAYIYTMNDKIIGMQTQKLYSDRLEINQTTTINTGHFPMYSKPDMLAKQIIKLSK